MNKINIEFPAPNILDPANQLTSKALKNFEI